jgi:hypothetical protein
MWIKKSPRELKNQFRARTAAVFLCALTFAFLLWVSFSFYSGFNVPINGRPYQRPHGIGIGGCGFADCVASASPLAPRSLGRAGLRSLQ